MLLKLNCIEPFVSINLSFFFMILVFMFSLLLSDGLCLNLILLLV